MVKYVYLVLGFILVSISQLSASDLTKDLHIDEAENILKKSSSISFDNLTEQEHKYLYEYMLATSLGFKGKGEDYSNENNIGFYLNELALYYQYNKLIEASKKVYCHIAKRNLEKALTGDSEALSLIIEYKGNDPLLNEISEIDEDSCHIPLKVKDGFVEAVAILADAYQKAGQKTLKARNKYHMAPCDLSRSSTFKSYIHSLLKKIK